MRRWISPSLSALALAACTEAAPDDPSWADVAPLLAAHCVRCHGAPAIGAPPTFRLDRYDDVIVEAGPFGDTAGVRRVLGAAAMAEWIAERAGDGSMPPRIPLAQYDRDLLASWFAARAPLDDVEGSIVLPRRGPPRPGNALPTLALDAQPGAAGYQLVYELRDPDRDLVTGELVAIGQTSGATIRASLGELHSGRGELELDAARFPAGRYQLEASLDDGSGVRRSGAGELQVEPPSPAPPRVTLRAPAQGDYLAASELPVAIELTAFDSDTAQLAVTATLVDDRATPTPIASRALSVAPGAPTRITLGDAALPAGLGYRVLVEVSDGQSSHRAQSGRFRVSRETTEDTFSSIADDLIGPYCLRCHAGFPRVPTLGIDLSKYRGADGKPGVYELRRRIYQRAVIAQDMPPGSARADGGAMSPDERARLARWLLAGAPEGASR
jgi:hypothetical protein